VEAVWVCAEEQPHELVEEPFDELLIPPPQPQPHPPLELPPQEQLPPDEDAC
jgi:hypothetical protein